MAMSLRSRALAVVATLHLAGLTVALAQLAPVGSEFEVNTYTTNDQSRPAVAADAFGNSLLVWQSDESADSDNSGSSIQARRYAGGTPDAQFQVNTYTTSYQGAPAVAVDGFGDFIVVWSSAGSDGTDTSATSIQAQRYYPSGSLLGAQFQVNSYTTSSQFSPAVAADVAGNFVVVWTSYGSAGSDTSTGSIQARRYDNTGSPQGVQFQVNAYTTNAQREPAVVADGAGNFVVVWASYGSADSDGGYFSVQGRRYNSAGLAQGGQFQVNTYTTEYQDNPAVAADGAGNFVVAWQSYGSADSDSSGWSVHGQRYDGTGVPQGGEFQVNTYTTGDQGYPAVAADGGGDFVVAWASGGGPSDTGSYSIAARLYDGAGTPQGSDFQVNTYTTGQQFDAALAVDGSNNVTVAWESGGSHLFDVDGTSIHAQRYAVPTTTTTTLPYTDVLPEKVVLVKPASLMKFVAPATLFNPSGTFTFPSVDPRTEGGSLRVFDAHSSPTAGDNTYPLAAGAWRGLGVPAGSKGYRYSGAGTPGDPCRVVLVKRSLIKAVCRGSGVTLTPPFPGDVGIVLSLGSTDRYCAQCSFPIRNDPIMSKWTSCFPPPFCPGD